MQHESPLPPQQQATSLRSDDEPIAALASGGGAAAIAILRLSGAGCHELAQRCLRKKSHAPSPWIPRQVSLAELRDPASGELIDEPLVVFFKAPHSYTGQDALEIFVHGGPYIVQRALAILFAAGFRPAEPGEFTRRAFLGGKMDLTSAEGIGELVAAASHQQWVAGRQLASGKLWSAIDDLRRLTMEAMAWLEARIDFPDEAETSAVEMQEVAQRVGKVKAALARLEASYDNGRIASRGLMVALVGEPNAGKSTLLNSLLGSERAIVTEHAGTTRDYLEEPCLVEGRLVRLVDTAGIREEGFDPIEKLGIERSLAIAKQADVVVFLLPADADASSRATLSKWRQELGAATGLTVLTKTDLGRPAWLPELSAEHPAPVGAPPRLIELSCHDGRGLVALKQALATIVDSHVSELSDEEPFITSARHKAAIATAQAALARFEDSLAAAAYEEMLAFELQEVAKALASIIGEVAADDVLGVIFSSFCVGK